MSDRAPDVAGEIVAVRTWELKRLPRGDAVLLSLNGTVWSGDGWQQAACGRSYGCETPGEDCSCGIYAAKSRLHLETLDYHDDVIGELALVGKVIVAENGYRAERARPLRLWVPFDDWDCAAPLAQRYGVTVGLADTFDLADSGVTVAEGRTRGHR